MPTLISKEDIPRYTVIPAFVDNTESLREQFSYAVRLGNEFKGKTSITFETTQGPKTVETTIWSLADDLLQLKGGIYVPLNSIIEVHF